MTYQVFAVYEHANPGAGVVVWQTDSQTGRTYIVRDPRGPQVGTFLHLYRHNWAHFDVLKNPPAGATQWEKMPRSALPVVQPLPAELQRKRSKGTVRLLPSRIQKIVQNGPIKIR